MNREKLVDNLAEQFFAAEPVAEKIGSVIAELRPSPMALAVALLLIDKMTEEQVEGWVGCKELAKDVFFKHKMVRAVRVELTSKCL